MGLIGLLLLIVLVEAREELVVLLGLEEAVPVLPLVLAAATAAEHSSSAPEDRDLRRGGLITSDAPLHGDE